MGACETEGKEALERRGGRGRKMSDARERTQKQQKGGTKKACGQDEEEDRD